MEMESALLEALGLGEPTKLSYLFGDENKGTKKGERFFRGVLGWFWHVLAYILGVFCRWSRYVWWFLWVIPLAERPFCLLAFWSGFFFAKCFLLWPLYFRPFVFLSFLWPSTCIGLI